MQRFTEPLPRPSSGASPPAGEKLVLHKLRFHPDSVAPFSPPCEGGVRGGWSRHDQSQGLPMLSPFQSFRIPLARREESFLISKAPAPPPLAPPSQGGEKDRSLPSSVDRAQQKPAPRTRPSSTV